MRTSQPSDEMHDGGGGCAHAGLRVTGISHSFPAPGAGRFLRRGQSAPVLEDVSFETAPGTLTAIIGASGCGKSTLLRMLAGFIIPDSGGASVAGADLIGRPGQVAYHPQSDALVPWLRVIDNAIIGAQISGVPRPQAKGQAHDLLDRFGLRGHESSWTDELSGGMRQRVALLRTFITPLPLLAFDEPLGALDALTRRSLQQWLLEITQLDGRPIVLVTHDIDEALLLADQIIVMGSRPGRIVHAQQRPGVSQRLREYESGSDRPLARKLLSLLG